MDGLRLVGEEGFVDRPPCARCGATGCAWDRIGGAPVCPDCQAALSRGEGEAMRVPVGPGPCAVCGRSGSVALLTFPLRSAGPVEIDLCPPHFRALIRRGLDPSSYHQLGRRLRQLGLSADRVFLLHEAFYDAEGRALRPVPEVT
jgi:hypothetical protein